MTTELNIASIASMPFDENTYVLWREGRTDCVVIDPGFEPQKIIAMLATRSLTPVAILNTHGHSDHIAGNGAMKERWPAAPLVIGEGDAYKLTDANGNLSAGYGLELISPAADVTVVEGETYKAAGIVFDVLETPGHSAGHVVFVVNDQEPIIVVGGDVLFRRGIGRTDFFDGDAQALIDSIHTKLFTLPGSTVVLPGHGESTTVAEEIRENPWVGIPGGYDPPSGE